MPTAFDEQLDAYMAACDKVLFQAGVESLALEQRRKQLGAPSASELRTCEAAYMEAFAAALPPVHFSRGAPMPQPNVPMLREEIGPVVRMQEAARDRRQNLTLDAALSLLREQYACNRTPAVEPQRAVNRTTEHFVAGTVPITLPGILNTELMR